MSSQEIMFFIVGITIGLLLSTIFFKSQRAHLTSAMEDLKKTHSEQLAKAQENGLSVVTYPYKEQNGQDGYFSDERSAEIGYKFQLFVSGIPCFEAFKIPIETLTKKEVNVERIEQAMNRATDFVSAIASKHPAIAALKVAPTAVDAAKAAIAKNSNVK